ncbi:MAG: glycoside hydrolase family 9 protein [Spirochaetales bacterium]|uniref:Endoglucanase n=1 Tax=Candidatus Thalassospirochaeta sargassi TaxID=3119039 RepID=A0AAJ1MKI3_9SPIO|nr:glycoside hydrolase family 9 protein [Spirochaetales bacterium]
MNDIFTEYDVFDITIHSYKYQHCGTSIYGECHMKPAIIRPNGDFIPSELSRLELGKVDVSGGWHDAGDYGKYIPTAAVTVYQLLLLADLFPVFAAENPVLLEEAAFELSWMLKMQDDDGGVYHKVNTYDFCDMVMPDMDTEPQLLYEKSSSAAAYFAAATAYACRFNSNAFPARERIYDSAIRAGNYLKKILPPDYEVLPSVDRTGPYIPAGVDTICIWAFAELYRLTGDRQWYDLCVSINSMHMPVISGPLGWENMSAAAVWALYQEDGTAYYREQILAEAERICRCSADDDFGCALQENEYLWGSNKFAAAYGLLLILAAEICDDTVCRKLYYSTASKQLKYILGNNALGKCFITGFGNNPVCNPHHRIVQASKTVIPGLLVGGPNNSAEDGCYPAGLGKLGYADLPEAYSCNEYAVDYNAPLVFLSGGLAALKKGGQIWS